MISWDKLITAHPGGYQDIVAFLHSQGDEVVSKNVDDCLNSSSTGECATRLHNILIKFQLPTPGGKDWDKLCAFWPSPKELYVAPPDAKGADTKAE